MSNFIDNSFSIFPTALMLHERRAEVLANNLTNQDTPNFKAQDIDFKTALETATSSNSANAVRGTQSGHMDDINQLTLMHLKYRQSMQPSLDGNTVDGQIERGAFMQNNMRMVANLSFLTNRIQGLMHAIKGVR